MSDPYKVLNISPGASDDEVKHAYRELARKYHPDNYHDNPLADLAQEKMKEINEAYEQIQKQRRGGASSYTPRGGGYSYGYGTENTYGASSGDPLLNQVRMAVNSGNVTQAERLLNEADEHNAEWHFLMGVVCSRRGWLDEARRYVKTACEMDPGNPEYRRAYEMFSDGAGYRPAGYRRSGTMTYGESDCIRLCTAWSCCVLSGGRCFFC